MANIICKICGSQVQLPDGLTVGECPVCGAFTTFPKIADGNMEQLYARAELFRQQGDFDKAAAFYETILSLNGEDPEAHWGLLLSRCGIVYAEDPATHRRVPICRRERRAPSSPIPSI